MSWGLRWKFSCATVSEAPSDDDRTLGIPNHGSVMESESAGQCEDRSSEMCAFLRRD